MTTFQNSNQGGMNMPFMQGNGQMKNGNPWAPQFPCFSPTMYQPDMQTNYQGQGNYNTVSDDNSFSFMMPVASNGMGSGVGETQLEAFKEAFGNNFQFYNNNCGYTPASVAHQGFMSGCENVCEYEELKKATKKSMNEDNFKVEKKKRFYFCC